MLRRRKIKWNLYDRHRCVEYSMETLWMCPKSFNLCWKFSKISSDMKGVEIWCRNYDVKYTYTLWWCCMFCVFSSHFWQEKREIVRDILKTTKAKWKKESFISFHFYHLNLAWWRCVYTWDGMEWSSSTTKKRREMCSFLYADLSTTWNEYKLLLKCNIRFLNPIFSTQETSTFSLELFFFYCSFLYSQMLVVP